MNWYLKVLENYAVFRGRARRKEYWMFVLVNTLISAVLFGLDVLLRGSLEVAAQASIGLSSVYGLAVLLPSIAVQARRLHDLDRTGWWLSIVLVPQAVAWLVGLLRMVGEADRFGLSDPMHPVLVGAGVFSVAGWLILFVMFCLKGTSGSNRYGADPLGAQDEDGDVWPDVA